MKEFDLGHGRKIRIWRNEEVAKLQSTSFKNKIYTVSEAGNFVDGVLISELFIPRGGRNLYGLLGFKYIANNSPHLKVSTPLDSFPQKKEYKDSLLMDHVLIGIPEEYQKYIIHGADKLVGSDGYKFAGTLEFRYGAYNQTSSSGWVFEKLTKILLNLFLLNKNNFDEHDIIKILAE